VKKIEAIIRQEKLEAVKEELEKIGILAMTVSAVSGRGRQKGITLQWRAGEYRIDFLPKVKLEIVCGEEDWYEAAQTICRVARTGKEGDGMLFVLPVETAFRVRTGDNGEICARGVMREYI
jgi:nitrogen regulatory protein P-II 1